MKHILILITVLFTGCSIPQGTNCFLDDKHLSFSFDQGNDYGVLIKDGNKSIATIVNSKSYGISPSGRRYHVSKSEPYSFTVIEENLQNKAWITRVYFEDDKNKPLKNIDENGKWVFYLVFEVEEHVQHEEQFAFNVSTGFYIPYLMPPN